MAAGVGCRRGKYTSWAEVTRDMPLKRPTTRIATAQATLHSPRRPLEQGNDNRDHQIGNGRAPHQAPGATALGLVGIAPRQRNQPFIVDHPSVCNAACKNVHSMPMTHDHVLKPLPPSGVPWMMKRYKNSRRQGVRIRPWLCPLRPTVSVADSKGDVTGRQL